MVKCLGFAWVALAELMLTHRKLQVIVRITNSDIAVNSFYLAFP